MALTVTQMEDLADEAMNLSPGDYEIRVLAEYSGRYMYGAKVPAFDVQGNTTAAVFALAYVVAIRAIPFADLPRRVDTMGLGKVIY